MEVMLLFYMCINIELVKKTKHECEFIVEVIVIYCPLVPNIGCRIVFKIIAPLLRVVIYVGPFTVRQSVQLSDRFVTDLLEQSLN
jgi:hypothetical protein